MFTIIEDVLPIEIAKDLSNKIYNKEKGPRWMNAYRCGEANEPRYLPLERDEGTIYNDISDQELTSSLQEGYFTYKLKRTVSHIEECSCYDCKLRTDILDSQWFKEIIIKETTIKHPYIHENFLSLYEQGDFLSMHTDKAMDCAFVLHLTPEWKPEYGGLLHIKQEDGTYTTLCPKFNSLVLMDLNRPEGKPHFVSEVTSLAPYGRAAISGWYNETQI